MAEDAAAVAVRRERERMAADTAASLREHLAAVRVLSETDLAAPRATSARLVHARARRASSELRRHLGLLRDPGPAPSAAEPEADRRGRVLGAQARFVDLLLGTLLATVALAEPLAARATEYADRGWLTEVLTVVVAFTAVWHRSAPVRASMVAAGLFLAGAAVGEGVLVGLWLVGLAGVLLWATLARRGRGWVDVGAGVTFAGVAAISTMLTDPVNGPMSCAILAALMLVAGTTGLVRQAAARQTAEAIQREATIEHASGLAVHAERAAFARELHDSVSHAVGLIAMQAAAAEVSWTTDRPAALRAMATIHDTATATLDDLDRLQPLAGPGARSAADLVALIARVEAAGTAVQTFGLDLVTADQLPVVYRIVQEALTNVLRHAPGAQAKIEVIREADPEHGLHAMTTTVRVTDNGPGGPRSADRGYGLVGLRERVEYAGGSLDTGPGPAGGFRVEAVLPDSTEPLDTPVADESEVPT